MEKSKPSIRSAHPSIAELESATALLSAASADYCRSSNWVGTLNKAILPGAWTMKIELAMGNEAESAKLRQIYREKSLHFMTGYVQEVSNRAIYVKARIDFLDALRAVLSLYDSIEERTSETWLRPILQAAIVSGEAEYTKQENLVRGLPRDESDRLASQVEEHVFFEFKTVCEQAPTLARTLSRLQDSPTRFGRCGGDDVPQRNVFATPLVPRDELLANVRLYELLQKLDQAHRGALDAARFLKEENGRVNEQQHANRMIDVLFEQDRATCGVPTDPAAAVQAQNARRVQYECGRHVLLVAVRSFKQLHESVVGLFAEAAGEAFTFCDRVHTERQQNRAVTIDEIIAYRCVMNNLLAIELRLRRLAPDLTEVSRVLYADRASGAGADALAAEFERVAKVYRLVTRRSAE